MLGAGDAAALPGRHSGVVFEQFSKRARRVVALAQDEARELHHGYVGSEHLLLGLLREQTGVAAQALHSLGLNRARVRTEVVRIVGAGEVFEIGQIPFTPRAEKIFEHATQEALRLNQSCICTEHILHGLVRVNEGVGFRILVDFKATPTKVRDAVTRLQQAQRSE